MAPVDRRGAELEIEVGGVDRTIEERNLIVVRVVHRPRQRVSGPYPVTATESALHLDEQPIVFGARARLDVDDPIRSAHNRVEDFPDRSANQKVPTTVVEEIHS